MGRLHLLRVQKRTQVFQFFVRHRVARDSSHITTTGGKVNVKAHRLSNYQDYLPSSRYIQVTFPRDQNRRFRMLISF